MSSACAGPHGGLAMGLPPSSQLNPASLVHPTYARKTAGCPPRSHRSCWASQDVRHSSNESLQGKTLRQRPVQLMYDLAEQSAEASVATTARSAKTESRERKSQRRAGSQNSQSE